VNVALTETLMHSYNTADYTNPWGFSMKGIRALEKCPKCHGSWEATDKGYRCPECLTHPKRYRIDFYYKGERFRSAVDLDGKTLATFADAHALLKRAQSEIENHKFDPERWRTKTRIEYSFSFLIDKWYQEKEQALRQGKLAPSYLPKLWQYIRIYYLPFFGKQDIREIFNLKDFANQLPDRLSLKYQKNILDALVSFFRWLKDDRLIDEIPKHEKIEVPEHDFKVIRPETQGMILEKIPSEHKPIFTFLFKQGCRPSEVRALKWKDIDGDIVTIGRTWSNHVLREQTKTKRIRHILLFPEVMAALPTRRFPEDFVFLHGKILKRPYSKTFLNDIFQTACTEIELKISLYEATKHSFGTYHGDKGVSKDLLKEWFGHSSMKTTERYVKAKKVDAFRQMVENEEKVKTINKRPQTGHS
jgi:integrase